MNYYILIVLFKNAFCSKASISVSLSFSTVFIFAEIFVQKMVFDISLSLRENAANKERDVPSFWRQKYKCLTNFSLKTR